jgi:hypothetical protein
MYRAEEIEKDGKKNRAERAYVARKANYWLTVRSGAI